MARQPLYDKAEKRTVRDTAEERDRRWAIVNPRGAGNKQVTIEWDLNEDAKRDSICRITIGDQVALVDKEQMMKYLRWV